MNVVPGTASVKYGKTQVVEASAVYGFKKAAVGAVTYSRVAKSSSAWLPKIDFKTGAITVKAGAPKGKTYSVNVKVVAKGNGNYKGASKAVTVKVKWRNVGRAVNRPFPVAGHPRKAAACHVVSFLGKLTG